MIKVASYLLLPIGLWAVSTLNARADDQAQACSDNIKATVEAQAKSDFPNQNLVAVMPTVYFDGGSVDSYDIPVVNPSNPSDHIAVYGVQTDENCSVFRIYKE